jgi:hypothetical protein
MRMHDTNKVEEGVAHVIGIRPSPEPSEGQHHHPPCLRRRRQTGPNPVPGSGDESLPGPCAWHERALTFQEPREDGEEVTSVVHVGVGIRMPAVLLSGDVFKKTKSVRTSHTGRHVTFLLCIPFKPSRPLPSTLPLPRRTLRYLE